MALGIRQQIPRQARLLGAQIIPAAAQPEILIGDQKPILGIAQQGQSLARRRADFLAMQQQAKTPGLTAPHPPAQLVQLRQPKTLGMLDHHHIRRAHIHTNLDNRRRHQNPHAPGGKIRKGGITLCRLLLPMRQRHLRAKPCLQ